MKYDIIGGETMEDFNDEIMTIGNLIELALEYPNHVFRFLGTDYYPDHLEPWRDSCDIPCIVYSKNAISGAVLARILLGDLVLHHQDYKGNMYKYDRNDTFYVSEHDKCEEYMVVGQSVSAGNKYGEVLLLTKKILG